MFNCNNKLYSQCRLLLPSRSIPIVCPSNTFGPANAINVTSCKSNTGFYGMPGSTPSACPQNTLSTPGTRFLSNCTAIPGYFATGNLSLCIENSTVQAPTLS